MATNGGGTRLDARAASNLTANSVQPIVSAASKVSNLKPPTNIYGLTGGGDTTMWFILQCSTHLDLLHGAPGKFHPDTRQWEVPGECAAICIARFLEAGVRVEVLDVFTSTYHWPPRRAVAGAR